MYQNERNLSRIETAKLLQPQVGYVTSYMPRMNLAKFDGALEFFAWFDAFVAGVDSLQYKNFSTSKTG